MKRAHSLLLLAGLGLAGFLVYRYRGSIAALVAPQPDTTGLLRSQYGRSLDVPGTIAGATGAAARPGSSPISTVLGIVGDVLGGAGSSGAASYGGASAGAQPQGLTPAGVTPLPTDVIDQYLTGDVMV